MPTDPEHNLLVGNLQEEGMPDWKQPVFDRLLFEGLVDQAHMKEGDMVRHQEVDMERPQEVDMERRQEGGMRLHLLVQGIEILLAEAGIESQAVKDIEGQAGIDIERRAGRRLDMDLLAVELGMIQRVAAGMTSP